MKRTSVIFLTSISLLAVSLASTISFSYLSKGNMLVANAADTVESYYSSITDSMSGDTLLNALHSLNNSKRKKLVSYAGMRQFAAVCDADPNGSGKIVGFYDNALVGPSWDSGNTWNREHVWPNVRGGSSVEGDAHMTRPASTKTNSDRGSKGYGLESYDPGQFVAYYRGAASRIILYAAIADTNLHLVDDPLNYHGGSPANSMGSLSEMLKWNLEYQPSDTSFTGANDLARRTELNRNEKIQKASGGQGNRNPFIDHPEYACRIWGNYNEKTKAICNGGSGGGDTPDPETLESITLDVTSKTINVGESFKLNYTTNPASLYDSTYVKWWSENATIASVDNEGNVKGIKEGTTKIYVANSDSTIKAYCEVKVEELSLKGISFSTTSKSIEVNKTFKLDVVIDPAALSGKVDLVWYSEDAKVATVDEAGNVKGIANGKTKIHALTYDYAFEAICEITVGTGEKDKPSGEDKKTSNGCGGNIVSTSVILSTISLLGIGLLLIRKKAK